MTWLLAARTFVGSIPRWAWIALGVIALVIAAILYINGREKAAVEADRAKSGAEAASTAREADESAHTAAQGKSQEVSDANDRAREAARGSDDPLADGLRALRD